MPTYLVHGFRWPRSLIRIHIILQNLEDAAAEWLIAPATTKTMLQNFTTLYPHLMSTLPSLRFVEQYDPLDENIKSQPFAYVCDIVHEVKLGIDVEEVRGKGVDNEAWGSLIELRDQLAPGEKVGWFVVVCGDTERWVPPAPSDYLNGNDSSTGSGHSRHSGSENGTIRNSGEQDSQTTKSSKGFKKWFGSGGLRKTRSFKDLRATFSPPSTRDGAAPPMPPLPKSRAGP
ncbi:hypothetical protein EJ05DRAFT_483916 [Pseudovirgaria hyperparasitica]|uniref:Developmental regulator protein n=1 Tax=Pseudovirgaria hyperparasitica TaxID=470096 RepID=A0A6A6WC28_9PEZI|nr:uncharacterized protein EJ05DRAFT_483916 [Pseudovirgaria hyperparasitica]KAF2760135.1 hypothetical protein EJ05DRAFT_483916 [Pseudovirgaria hyperparasitica]